MAVHVAGLISVVVFYIFILAIGIYASRKTTKTKDAEEMFVANRSLGFGVTLFTLTATMVGGGFINGTAESMAFNGLIWTNAPAGYCLSLVIGGIFYVRKMRREKFITMFDPFQNKYGNTVGAVLFIPQLLGDVFWGASILAALGSTLAIILEINRTLSIIVSAVVAIVYTFFGGLYAVAYTDVAQLAFIAVGLFIAFPFAMHHEAVDFSTVEQDWFGTVEPSHIAVYIDTLLLIILGGIPWQTFYQRVLACKTPQLAMTATLGAAVMSVVLSIPPVVMGYTGRATDWKNTSYGGPIPIPETHRSFVLPMVLEYLCPTPIAIMGMGAVAGAVMSSSDSCCLASATVFAENVYKNLFRKKASKAELIWVLRVAIFVVGVLQTLIAITANSVYGLFILCSDLMYVIMFPQLTFVLFYKISNSYGCIAGYFVSFFLRMVGGEALLAIPALVHYPYWSAEHGQLFPFKTFSMLCGSFALFSVSLITHELFTKGKVSQKWDVLKAFKNEPDVNGHRIGYFPKLDTIDSRM